MRCLFAGAWGFECNGDVSPIDRDSWLSPVTWSTACPAARTPSAGGGNRTEPIQTSHLRKTMSLLGSTHRRHDEAICRQLRLRHVSNFHTFIDLPCLRP